MRSLLIMLLFPVSAAAQLMPTLLATLGEEVNETSGMIMVGGTLWSHPDSNNPARLYQVDPQTGATLRSVAVNATNVDWEDMTTDGSYVYLGDIGNNSGSRTDLRIYRFPIGLLMDTSVTAIDVDTIYYAYSDQVDFTSAMQTNPWDCEAMIARNDTLYLFTKDWVDQRTRVYALPAEPGTHQAVLKEEYDIQGLITGASHEPITDQVILIGYTPGLYVPFICKLSGFEGSLFFSGEVVRTALSLSFLQMEAVAWNGPAEILISNEQSPFSDPRLWSIAIVNTVDENRGDHGIRIYPNPTGDRFKIEGIGNRAKVILYDAAGREVARSGEPGEHQLEVGRLSEGFYQLSIQDSGAHVRRNVIVQR